MTHEVHCIVRLDIETRKTEYIQVPIQIVPKPNLSDQVLWDIQITEGSPIVVNEFVFSLE